MLAPLRCPECTAPLRALPRDGEAATCTYCGAALTIAAPAAGRTEEHYSVVLRVGPSNVDRVARVLQDFLSVEPDDARARLAKPPSEFAIGLGDERAHTIELAAREAGAQAELVTRHVAIPLRTVMLEDAGANGLAVIVALRAEVELSIVEAKRMIAGTPCVVVTGVEEPIARALVAALEATGAKATAR